MKIIKKVVLSLFAILFMLSLSFCNTKLFIYADELWKSLNLNEVNNTDNYPTLEIGPIEIIYDGKSHSLFDPKNVEWQSKTPEEKMDVYFYYQSSDGKKFGEFVNASSEYYWVAIAPNENACWLGVDDDQSTHVFLFEIKPYDVTNCAIDTLSDHIWEGEYSNPEPVVRSYLGSELTETLLVEGTDYTYSWSKQVPSKTYPYEGVQTLTITGINNYTGTNQTVTYKETRQKYNITFNYNDSIDKPASNTSSLPSEYYYGVSLNLPSISRDGYSFKGWSISNSDTGKYVKTISDTEKGDKTYYAIWGPVKTPANDNNNDDNTVENEQVQETEEVVKDEVKKVVEEVEEVKEEVKKQEPKKEAEPTDIKEEIDDVENDVDINFDTYCLAVGLISLALLGLIYGLIRLLKRRRLLILAKERKCKLRYNIKYYNKIKDNVVKIDDTFEGLLPSNLKCKNKKYVFDGWYLVKNPGVNDVALKESDILLKSLVHDNVIDIYGVWKLADKS